MRGFFRWLRADRRGVALHPVRILDLDTEPVLIYRRLENILRDVVGGHVTDAVPPHRIEAAFGLIDSERLSITIDATVEGSRVTLQSRRIAAAPQSAVASPYIETIARLLQRGE